MTTNPFRVGETVQLKTGGPPMTIQRIMEGGMKDVPVTGIPMTNKGDLYCCWFVDKDIMKASFRPDMIERTSSSTR